MKKYLLTAVALMTGAAVWAQDVETIVVDNGEGYTETVVEHIKPSAKSNWFLSIGAGPQIFFGDHDRECKLGDRISPALDFAVGKWFSPNIGVRLMYSGLSAKGATQTWGGKGVHSTGKPVPGKYTHPYGFLEKSEFDFMTLHADIMFDFTNIIGGYNSHRVYGIAPYIGVGWGHVFQRPRKDKLIGNVGLFNMFHLPKGFDINLDFRATITQDEFDGEKGRRDFDGIFSVVAGLTYNIPSRGWKARTVQVVEYDNDAINALRKQVNDLIAQNERLEKEMAGKVVEHKTVANANGTYLIYFPINVSSLSNADRAQLEEVAKMIKQTKGTFTVVGYADKQTGNSEINETLSRERAESVRACLVNEFGIPADRLNVSWRGGVDTMFFNDPALSRVVIIAPK